MDDYRDHVLGRAGERAAERWLIRRGWRILATRWRGGGGEIDIVAERRGIVATCEVKTAPGTTPTCRPSARGNVIVWPVPRWRMWHDTLSSPAMPYAPT